MNAAERVLAYAELPREGTATRAGDISQAWPERGSVEFEDVRLAYREGLPLVLKGVSFSVKAGEKVCRQMAYFPYLEPFLPRYTDRNRGPYGIGEEHAPPSAL